MEFQDTRVLVDGMHLAERNGTGIRTYGLTVLEALGRLGISTDLLASANWHPDPLVARAQLRDVPLRKTPRISRSREHWRHRLRMARVAEAVPAEEGTPPASPEAVFPFGHGCAVSAGIFEHAFDIQRKFSFPLRFRTRRKYSVWHATMPMPLIPRGLPTITTVHDLIPLLDPWACPIDRPAYVADLRLAVRQSRVIAAVSETTKRDLHAHFDVADEKVRVTHQPSRFEHWRAGPHTQAGILRELDLAPQGYLLFVGNLEPKKNVGRLIRAYLGLECDLPLLIVGRKAWDWEADLAPLTANPALQKKVRLLGFVDEETLPYLYESAYALAFPSLVEGYGLPLLEAMSVGCPALCGRIPALEEIGGDAVQYVEPRETESIALGLERLLRDRAYRDDLAARGRERARKFSMEAYVAQVRRLYEQALAA